MAAAFQIERSTRTSRVTALVSLVLLVVLIAAPWWAGRANMRLLGEIYSFVALATLWNLMAGYAGLVSVGQQAFVGFGGYALFAFAMFLGVHPLVAVPLAGVAGALIALPIAPLLFRLQGAYFAIGTWVLAEVFRLSFAQVSSLGGGSGTSLPAGVVTGMAADRALREMAIYWTALAIAVVAVAYVIALLRSRAGLALTALRDSEIASESLGIDIWRTKLTVYVTVAGLTAMTGAMIFLQKLRISPDAAFSVNDWTAYVIFIAVIGGIGTIEGPIVGTILFFLLRETLADLGTTYLMVLGAVAILVMLRAPKGLWGWVSQRTGVTLVPVRRRVVFRD
ncbi:branched-chain amino acid ABC transporter permease [Mesorhizobium sp. J428]|uniref:branched-chain amino acid ABC transporter permease n=1 Tax=Mesorhizobium sp. J428 TaxID=2898440 RepID=UPI0021507BED|nr:branched-chain amino acid ABC transporter permease [Mesorhizobium sp. J428]MCR5855765.1 branched-chain amino acid ABC transporter permease [Mesorhizobium sp. J428]